MNESLTITGASTNWRQKLNAIDKKRRKNKRMAVIPKYTQVYIYQSFSCQNCGKGHKIESPLVCLTPNDVVALGEKLHGDMVKTELVICSEMDLCIKFDMAFILSDSIKKMASPIVSKNGKL